MDQSQARQDAERREREEMFSVHPNILRGVAQPRRVRRAGTTRNVQGSRPGSSTESAPSDVQPQTEQ